MKFKAVRTSLAAVLTATLLISLLPLAYAGSDPSQTQQGANSSQTRRGKNGDKNGDKNGEPVTKSPDNPDASPDPSAAQDDRTETAKPETAKEAQPVQSSTRSPGTATEPARTAGRTATWPDSTGAAQSSSQSQQKDAPPFDRPPIGSQGSSSRDSRQDSRNDSTDRSNPSSRPATQRPTYSGESSSRGDSRRQTSSWPDSAPPAGTERNRYPQSSSGTDVDPERTTRSGGQPPVLQRPADSRRPADTSSTDKRPPVLHRPTDAEQGDGTRSDSSAGRRPTPGQQQDGTGQHQSGGEDDVIKLESTLINLPLLVSDRSGRYIPQLSAKDFTLYEDGVQQTIASFGSEEVPFSVVLLLDVSPSVAGNVQDIQEAAIAFVRQLRSQDRVMVVSFDRQIHYLSNFTSDRRELEGAIRRADTGSGTSVYDAVYETVERKLRNLEGRKALILFSDGEDTTSGHASYDDAVNLVTESDVLVYGLRYPGGGNGRGGIRVDPWPRSPIPGVQLPFPFPFPWPLPRRRRGPFTLSNPATGNSVVTATAGQWQRRNGGGRGRGGDFMADITAAGGGPVYDAERIGDLSRVAQRIADELRHVYVISYYPTNPLSNGGYRSVRVSMKGRDDIAVRHRRGYNARPNGTGRPTI